MTKKAATLSKFETFVRTFGIRELAARLEVGRTAVHNWLSGNNSLDPTNAMKIQQLARQRGISLSLDEIYQHSREVGSRHSAASSLKPQPARP